MPRVPGNCKSYLENMREGQNRLPKVEPALHCWFRHLPNLDQTFSHQNRRAGVWSSVRRPVTRWGLANCAGLRRQARSKGFLICHPKR